MISEIQIGNFKAFGPAQTIPVRRITLVFGPNSAGKSSIIQSLLLARHIHDTGNADAHQTTLGGAAVDLGGFAKYVRNRDSSLPTTLRLVFAIPEEAEKRPSCDRVKTVGLDYSITRNANGTVAISAVTICFNGDHIVRFDRREDGAFRLGNEGDEASGLLTDFFCKDPIWEELGEKLAPDRWQLRDDIRERAEAAGVESAQLIDGRTGKLDVKACREHWNSLSFCPTELHLLKELKTMELRLRQLTLATVNPLDEPDTWSNKQELVGFYVGEVDEMQRREEIRVVRAPLWECETPDGRVGQIEIAKAMTARSDIERKIAFVATAVQATIESISYLGPLRWIPPRLIPEGEQFDASWAAGGGAAWQRLRSEPELLGRVNRFLQDTRHSQYRLQCQSLAPELDAEKIALCVKRALESSGAAPADDPHTSRVAEDAPPYAYAKAGAPDLAKALEEALKAELRAQNSGGKLAELSLVDAEGLAVSHRDVGTGISQLLPVLVNAAGGQNQLIAIEQPELHLHPALQAELGDVFIESALGKNNNTFLIETHSEQLILRIMRRIRESNAGKQPKNLPAIKPDDIAILFVQPTEGGAVVKHLRVDERGRLLDEWPGGFFEESFDEIF